MPGNNASIYLQDIAQTFNPRLVPKYQPSALAVVLMICKHRPTPLVSLITKFLPGVLRMNKTKFFQKFGKNIRR